MTAWQRLVLNSLLFVFATAISFGAAELGARLLGYEPFAPAAGGTDEEHHVAHWARFDDSIGWINKPGVRQLHSNGWFTILRDGSRITRRNEAISADSHIVVVGDSYSQGAGVGDEDTYAWGLQSRFPRHDVRNFGTGGYGAYQSSLALERFFEANEKPVKIVIFGFGDYLLTRDRATSIQVSSIRLSGMTRAFIPPHMDLIDGRFLEFEGVYHRAWAITLYSAFANLIQDTIIKRIERPTDNFSETTERVFFEAILRIKRVAERNGAKFVLAILRVNEKRRAKYIRKFEAADIHYVDCSPSNIPFAHPDPFWHRRHADCIGDFVEPMVRK